MSSLIKKIYFTLIFCANMRIRIWAENMSEPCQLVFSFFRIILQLKIMPMQPLKVVFSLYFDFFFFFFCMFTAFKKNANANATDKCCLSLLACILNFLYFFPLKVLPMQPINVVLYLAFVTVAPILFILLYCLFCYIMLFQYCKKCGVGQNY